MTQSPFEQMVAEAIASFGQLATEKLSGDGEPEANLRTPVEILLVSAGEGLIKTVTLHDESHLSELNAQPDWSVRVDGAICGHIELKAPGKGADPTKFKGKHDKEQWEKLRSLPNLLYTDGNQWGLYRDGVRTGEIGFVIGDVRISGIDLLPSGPTIASILTDFLNWQPVPPSSAKNLATVTAGLCRLLRIEVIEAMQDESSPLHELHAEWRQMLFPDADLAAFADGYAQAVTFALLLARYEDIPFPDDEYALLLIASKLGKRHGLLGRALAILTDVQVLGTLATSLTTMVRVIGVVDWNKIKDSYGDPWLYFYEHFLAEYDPELRKRTGSYYTPPQVVNFMTRLVQDALQVRLGLADGLATLGITIVDPAMGTGTYLVAAIASAASYIELTQGVGAVAPRLSSWSSQIVGFEKQIGPFAVSELRTHAEMKRHKAGVPSGGIRLFVTDTLDDPNVEVAHLFSQFDAIADSRRNANKVKRDEPVTVILGNPPYRAQAKGEMGWVESGNEVMLQKPIFDDFKPPKALRVPGNHTRHLNNLYVAFWRWATWKVFEAVPGNQSGVVCFITSAAWLDSDGFIGMRRHLRKTCDSIDVVDLGGGARGSEKTDNVFDILTPVAIVVATKKPDPHDTDASVRYVAIEGNRAEKYSALQKLASQSESIDWEDVFGVEGDPFVPSSTAHWADYPLLDDLVPWSTSGVVANRTWVWATLPSTLRSRWSALVEAPVEDKAELFRESYFRKFDSLPKPLPGRPAHKVSIEKEAGPCPEPVRAEFRSFDRQWLIPDARVLHGTSPNLWLVASDTQVYLTWKHNDAVTNGPAVTFGAYIPEIDHYNGRGGRAASMWMDGDGITANALPGVITLLDERFDGSLSKTDLVSYVAGIVAHGGYTKEFHAELSDPGVRVPLTLDESLFRDVVAIGERVIWLQCYGQRLADPAKGRPLAPPVHEDPNLRPKVVVAIPSSQKGMPESLTYDEASENLFVGEGQIRPVPSSVWLYEVSGMPVLSKWFGYRQKTPAGQHNTSLLDDIRPLSWSPEFTTELIDLLNVLRMIVDLEPIQADLLRRVIDGPLLSVTEMRNIGLLPVSPELRRSPLQVESDGLKAEQGEFLPE
jgi:hypothetical protein